jgi:iron complex outermembrane receptor protein
MPSRLAAACRVRGNHRALANQGVAMKNRMRRMSLAAGAIVAPMLACEPVMVLAQQEAGLEEIVVTARKREESLQDTPVSVTAFTGDMLEQQHITSLDDVAEATPNLVFDTGTIFSGSNAAAAVYIRGIGQIDYALYTDPGVGIYLDGVYVATSIGSVLDLVDIERVEVLRGPQGTLFGRNTIGGAISVTSKLPDDTLHGDLKVTAGAYDRIDAQGNVNVPLTDLLYAKFSAATFNRNGYVDSPNALSGSHLGDINRDAFRGALRFVPNERFEANFSADYHRARENGVPHVLVNVFDGPVLALGASQRDPASPNYIPPPAPTQGPNSVELHNILANVPFGVNGGIAGLIPGVVPNPLFGGPTLGLEDTVDVQHGDLVNSSNLDLSSDYDVWGVALTLDYDFGPFKAKSITSYREMEAHGVFDNDGQPFVTGQVINDFDSDQFSEELQFSGVAVDDRLNWLVGLYYFNEDGLMPEQVEFTGFELVSSGGVENMSAAGFGQATFDVTDKLSVTAGVRYTYENKEFIVSDDCVALPNGPKTRLDGTAVDCARVQSIVDPKYLNAGFLGFVNAPVFPAPGGRFCCLPVSDANGNIVGLIPGLTADMELLPRGSTELSFNDWTPQASIQYHWTDDLMTYFSYSEGFKSGGFSGRVFPPRTGVPTFDPETATVYEVGLKWTGFDNRVRFSASGFHTDYDDLQIQVTDVAPVTRNAGSADFDGFELELTAAPTPAWLIQGSVGYLDGEYTKLDDDQNLVTDLIVLTEDSKLPNAPKWSTSLGVQYAFEVPRFGGQLVPRLDWSYRSTVYNDALNFPELKQEGYHLLDLAMTYFSDDGKWEVSVFGKNVTDERYITAGFANILLGGWAVATVGRPAEWGASVAWHFD